MENVCGFSQNNFLWGKNFCGCPDNAVRLVHVLKFYGVKFCRLWLIRENWEIFTPWEYPTIRYMIVLCLYQPQALHRASSFRDQ